MGRLEGLDLDNLATVPSAAAAPNHKAMIGKLDLHTPFLTAVE